jgi:hypothetical protein
MITKGLLAPQKIKERCHKEIGAPDFGICDPFGLVLTPWDIDL